MAATQEFTLHLIQLNCYTQDEGDGDEIFLKLGKKRVWPIDTRFKKVKQGSVPLNIKLEGMSSEKMTELELWDYDFLTPNDKLGVFKMLVNEIGGPFTTDLQKNVKSTKYSLEWEVI